MRPGRRTGASDPAGPSRPAPRGRCNTGIVHGRRGARAGWTLAREPEAITLRDVYGAVEGNGLFTLHRTPPNEACPVGFGIRPALSSVYARLDEAVRDELAAVSIADVLRDAQAERRVAG
ncbi:Rrf2 family transcriptional regulator [Streptomyces griseoluteus]|uniref:Rrf2 family transcriptional regulator n=1 Tax=Streptomyces griseoluteus TaxID=29306 RepID=UPI00382D9459